jgi:hypothetical protein
MTNTRPLCVDKDGNVVLLIKLWQKNWSNLYLSVYGFVGIRAKRTELLHRERVSYEDFKESVADTHAHLWALRNGVSNFVVSTTATQLDVYHPTKEYRNELR